MKFTDRIHIKVSSGKGGRGCVSFRRERFSPRGGPDGGDGGAGGDIILKAHPELESLDLYAQKKNFKAGDGESGKGALKTGSKGNNVVLNLPLGTVVKDESGNVLTDIKKINEELILLKGGKGGRGNYFFKNSIDQAPSRIQDGLLGKSIGLFLELKPPADIVLLGLPNSGKSTLLSKLSRSKTKIGSYPFTTTRLQLGVLKLKNHTQMTIVDTPGITTGDREGKKNNFLFSLERSRAIAFVLDGNVSKEKDLIDAYRQINSLLKKHDVFQKNRHFRFDRKKQIIIINKIDVANPQIIENAILKFKKLNLQPVCISTLSEESINFLKNCLEDSVYISRNV